MNKILLTALALTLPLAGATAITFTSNSTIAPGDTAYEGAELIVSNCTLTVNGPHSFAALWLTNGAVLTHAPAASGESNHRLELTINGDVFIDPASRIDVNGRGYGSAVGPGAGAANSGDGGGGGSHGGTGGVGAGGTGGGSAYDLITAPTQWGSGGGVGYLSTPGAGGGQVRLIVGGDLRVDGNLTADGTPSTRPDGLGSYAGGGSGGALWLTTGSLSGRGSITANGGAGVNGGGGGGGRIAVELAANSFIGDLQSFGASGHQRGGAGSIFMKTNGVTTGLVRIDNGGNAGGITTLRAGHWPAGVVFNLLCTGAALVYPEHAQTLASLRVNGDAILSHAPQQKTFDLSVAGDAVIETNGQINVAGRGYAPTTGPGAGRIAFNGNAGGGGHGGAGGGAQVPYNLEGGGGTYDSLTEPTDFGSGGGEYRGGPGGGAVRLTVGGRLQLDGNVRAYGADATDTHYGGGAGGSVLLRVGAFSGTGFINAVGGWSGGPGGGGGGGRVAVYYQALDEFDTNRVSVAGGSGGFYGGSGTEGTVFWGRDLSALLFTIAGPDLRSSWFGIANINYQPQTTTNLANPAAWVNYGAAIAGTNGPASFAFPLTIEPQRYFRLKSGN